MRVLGAQTRLPRQARLTKLWIKIEIEPLGRVKKLQQLQYSGPWPHVLQEQAFAPARVGDDDIGPEPFRAQPLGGGGARLAAQHLGLEIRRPWMYPAAGAPLRVVTVHGDIRQPRAVDAQRSHHMTRALKRRRQVFKLARKVLVNEKDIHAHAPAEFPSFWH